MPQTALDIYDLLEQQYGVRVAPVFGGNVAQLTANDAIIMRQDPTIVGFNFINTGAATVALNPMAVASAAVGIQINPNGLFSVNWRDDGVLPALEWHAVSPGGNQNYTLIRLQVVQPGAM